MCMKTCASSHIFILSIISIIFSSCESTGKSNVLKHAENLPYLGMNGKIDSIIVRTYTADSIEGRLEISVPTNETVQVFDADGRVIQKVEKDFLMMASMKTDVLETKDGRIIKYSEITGRGDSSVINLVKIEGNTEYWVDTLHGGDSIFTDTILVEYKDKSRLTSFRMYNKGQIVTRSSEEIFNDKGHVIEATRVTGAIETHNKWRHNEDGTVESIERKIFEEYIPEGSTEFKKGMLMSKKVTYVYKKDENGNWTQAIELEGERPQAYLKRDIFYRK